MTIVTGGIEPRTSGPLESQKVLAGRISRAVDYAADRGVQLALEPLNPVYGGNRTCVMTVRDALRVCEMVDAQNLGIVVDVYHFWWDKALPEVLPKASGKVFGYHLCDWLEDTTDVLLDRGMLSASLANLKALRRLVEHAGKKVCAKPKCSVRKTGGNAIRMKFLM